MRLLMITLLLVLRCFLVMGKPTDVYISTLPDDPRYVTVCKLYLTQEFLENREELVKKSEKVKPTNLVGNVKNIVHDVTDFGAGLIKDGATNVEKVIVYTQDKASDAFKSAQNAVNDIRSGVTRETIGAIENVKKVVDNTGALLKDGVEFGGNVADTALDSLANLLTVR